LRLGDTYLGCELRPDDAERLRQTLRPFPGARAMQADGYATAVRQTPKGRALVLIDPPFEQPDDYERTTQTIAAVLKQNPRAVLAVWLPIKDLETLDAFRRGLALRGAPAFLAEARLRPLMDPMKMNGCAVLVVGAPKGAEGAARSAADWIVKTLGQAGGKAAVGTV
jgi:23S rRNA (adenine2030-N6)-methyltransferase